jgi:ComF family protein
MGGINVKNTIVERVLEYVAPHPCFGCGKVGTSLCQYCKYDIVNEPFVGCILCGKPEMTGMCANHGVAIANTAVVGVRQGVLKELIDGLKFHYVMAAARSAAELLHETLPLYPAGTVIVPVPTLSSHVRQRGFDQVALIARHFAALRGMTVQPLLSRVNKATQHRLNRDARVREAKSAFSYNAYEISVHTPILLIDDIITTGATITQASNVLLTKHEAVFVGALAYHPLD